VATIEKEIAYLKSIDSSLTSIKDELAAVAGGACRNAKIC